MVCQNIEFLVKRLKGTKNNSFVFVLNVMNTVTTSSSGPIAI